MHAARLAELIPADDVVVVVVVVVGAAVVAVAAAAAAERCVGGAYWRRRLRRPWFRLCWTCCRVLSGSWTLFSVAIFPALCTQGSSTEGRDI